MNAPYHVAQLLERSAERFPDRVAVAEPSGKRRRNLPRYRQMTYAELQEDSSRLASRLVQLGVEPGMRIVLLVRPGIDFVSLVFALFRTGAVTVLIDPGMGRANLVRCLQEVRPDGFVAVPAAQAVSALLAWKFPRSRIRVTVGRRWFWGGATLGQLRESGETVAVELPGNPRDEAAVIFTTGSTGVPKGVLYEHGQFVSQAMMIQQRYGVSEGEIDVPGFPLFALFSCALGVTTVFPKMDFTRPADVEPENYLQAISDWQATQSFGSPALWNRVGKYCEERNLGMPTIRRVLSAGAPVPPHVLRRLRRAIHPEGEIYTPYGATEALPVASISASVVLDETAAASAAGKGTCVGTRFEGVDWKVIRICDEPIDRMDQIDELPTGELGELLVTGPMVTRRYVTCTHANAFHKIADGDRVWHRMGDVGYLDEHDRFWFCGRKSHRVITAEQTLFTVPVEAVINEHPHVYRSALVGIGTPGRQRPVIVVETWPEYATEDRDHQEQLFQELRKRAASHKQTESIETFLLHPGLPVDIRHNSKIFREQLVPWAAGRLRKSAKR